MIDLPYIISPKVHKCLYQTAIKEFLESKEIDVNEEAERYNIDLKDDVCYSHLLDALIDNKVSVDEVMPFLLDELNYGRMKNIYISIIDDVSHIDSEEKALSLIKNLGTKGIPNVANITKCDYLEDLGRGLELGEERLLYSKLKKDDEGKIDCISLLIGVGIKDKDSDYYNIYYSIDVDVKDKLMITRLKNWTANIEDETVDSMYKCMEIKIAESFNLLLPSMTTISQKIAYSLISSLIKVVLEEPMKVVNDELGGLIQTQLEEWTTILLADKNVITPADYNVFKEIILNNFCKFYMLNELKAISVADLMEKFNIDGYPRYVNFIDETVGEARARSADVKESLLETSIFYDVKARLDQAKNIRMLTTYWVSYPGSDNFGLSLYTNAQGRLKLILLPHHYDKGMYEYVLRQIKKHIPKH